MLRFVGPAAVSFQLYRNVVDVESRQHYRHVGEHLRESGRRPRNLDLQAHREGFGGQGPLKLIQQPSVGYDNIDIKACSEGGIRVANAPTGNVVTVAEHTIAMGLALVRSWLPPTAACARAGGSG